MQSSIKKQLFEGKFDIQGEIAKGQTGTILYGYDLGLRQEVAIKIYHSNIDGRVIQGKAFIEKSQPLLLLDHPNLIKIFKLEEADNTPIVFMEFFDAPSLQQIIHDKGPMSVQDMLIRAREITEVLVHIHFQGIIHGTLHPGHVLVGPQGQVKVLDLGLSWILMDTLPNCDVELLRPLPYLPPEIAKEELLNVSSDLYCLGFMMYEMLTGTVPYAGLPKTSILGKLSFDQADPEFDFPAAVPATICDLIRHMTRNDTQQRLQDATHVLTIINQQLPRLSLSETHTSSESVVSQSQTPAHEESNTHQNPSAPTPQLSARTEPTLKKAPAFQRPKTYANYKQPTDNTKVRKIGITLSLLVAIGVAGTLGYWYHDVIESYFSTLQTQHEVPATGFSQGGPLKDTPAVTPDKNSTQSQEHPLKTKELLQDKAQPAPAKEKFEQKPQSDLTSLSTTADQELDKATSTQPALSPKVKQGNVLVPSRKQSEATPALGTDTSKRSTSSTASSTNTPPSSTGLKITPPQQRTVQPPTGSRTQSATPLTPKKNQVMPPPVPGQGTPKSDASTAEGSINTPQRSKNVTAAPPQQAQSPTVSKAQPSTILIPDTSHTMTAPMPDSGRTKPIRTAKDSTDTLQTPIARQNTPLQQATTQSLAISTTQPGKTLTQDKNEPNTTPQGALDTSTPVVSPATDSTNMPQPPKASTSVPGQQTTSPTPTNETFDTKTRPAQASRSLEKTNVKFTDEEMAKLLQSLDAPPTDIPSFPMFS